MSGSVIGGESEGNTNEGGSDPVNTGNTGGDAGGNAGDVSTPNLDGKGDANINIPDPDPTFNRDVKFPDNWKEGLEEDIRNDPSLKTVTDIKELAKSFVHAQRLVGGNKFSVPDKHATEADWKTNVFSKLGWPAELKDYKVTSAEGTEVNQKFMDGFREISHGLGILPSQAQKLFDWHQKTSSTMQASLNEQNDMEIKESVDSLKKDWGEGYQKKVQFAKQAVKEFGGQEMFDYFEKSGLGNNVTLIKLFSSIGEKLTDDVFKDGTFDHLSKTQEEASSEIKRIQSDNKHPYYDSTHPEHNDAVKQMSKLFEIKG